MISPPYYVSNISEMVSPPSHYISNKSDHVPKIRFASKEEILKRVRTIAVPALATVADSTVSEVEATPPTDCIIVHFSVFGQSSF